jgi:tRNA/rRNA methyltransferase
MSIFLLYFLGVIRTRFILIQTHHPGNVGASARALKTMGFDELVLVQPRDPKVLIRKRTKEGASGAWNVLEGSKVCDSLAEALEGTDLWCATGMPVDMSISREYSKYLEPRPYMEDLVQTKNIESISFVFGNERIGMTKEDIELCHVVLGIPTNPSFGSLNLASAVQLIAYDWRQALGGFNICDDE